MCKALTRLFLTPPNPNASLGRQPYWCGEIHKSRTQGAVSMRLKLSYNTLVVGLSMGLCSLVASGPALAQEAPAQQYTRTGPADADVYCSGVVTNQAVPTESYVISGENSR